jgi:hypothetical protein
MQKNITKRENCKQVIEATDFVLVAEGFDVEEIAGASMPVERAVSALDDNLKPAAVAS